MDVVDVRQEILDLRPRQQQVASQIRILQFSCHLNPPQFRQTLRQRYVLGILDHQLQGGAGQFAGTLTWQSGGTFSGTILTGSEYTGTADELFTAASNNDNIFALLLPAGYETAGYLTINSPGSYNAFTSSDWSKVFATSKARAVEQFSFEGAKRYNSGFALSPRNAILNFTITGLTSSTNVNVSFTGGISESVSTDASGNATFAVGVSHGDNLSSCSLTVDGNAIALPSKTAEAGHIYNITRSATPAPSYTLISEATVNDYGKVVCEAGHLHDAKTAVPAGCTAVGIFCKLSGYDGLIIALEDANNQTWNTINGWDSEENYAGTTLKLLSNDAFGRLSSYTKLGNITVSNWAVAQKSVYDEIFKNLGSTKGDSDGMTYDANVNAYFTSVGGVQMDGYYWSATEKEDEHADYYGWVFKSTDWGYEEKGKSYNVRPVLAF